MSTPSHGAEIRSASVKFKIGGASTMTREKVSAQDAINSDHRRLARSSAGGIEVDSQGRK
jgi:hypothetical protein